MVGKSRKSRDVRALRLSFLMALLAALVCIATPAFAGDDEPAVEEKAEEPTAEEPKAEEPTAEEATDTESSGDFAKLAGDWHSEWGPVKMQITGNKVTGSWSGDQGSGTFEGTFDAKGVLVYSWTDTNGDKGYGTFQADGDKRMVGRFGFGESQNNGGDWTLSRK